MDGSTLLHTVSLATGVSLIALALSDVIMTVLYARAGTGPLSRRLAAVGWAAIRQAARCTPKWKDDLLGFFAPLYIVVLLSVWLCLLIFGFTLIVWAGLGRGVVSQSGTTPTDLVTAFNFAGSSLTTV